MKILTDLGHFFGKGRIRLGVVHRACGKRVAWYSAYKLHNTDLLYNRIDKKNFEWCDGEKLKPRAWELVKRCPECGVGIKHPMQLKVED